MAERGTTMTIAGDKRELARLTLAETIDAMRVLSEGSLASEIDPSMQLARAKLLAAKLALEGETSEWLKEHAWKAMRWSDVETYRSTFPQPLQRLSSGRMSLGVCP